MHMDGDMFEWSGIHFCFTQKPNKISMKRSGGELTPGIYRDGPLHDILSVVNPHVVKCRMSFWVVGPVCNISHLIGTDRAMRFCI